MGSIRHFLREGGLHALRTASSVTALKVVLTHWKVQFRCSRLSRCVLTAMRAGPDDGSQPASRVCRLLRRSVLYCCTRQVCLPRRATRRLTMRLPLVSAPDVVRTLEGAFSWCSSCGMQGYVRWCGRLRALTSTCSWSLTLASLPLATAQVLVLDAFTPSESLGHGPHNVLHFPACQDRLVRF